jgi:hypothetical protein
VNRYAKALRILSPKGQIEDKSLLAVKIVKGEHYSRPVMEKEQEYIKQTFKKSNQYRYREDNWLENLIKSKETEFDQKESADLDEGMTTSDVFSTTLPAQGAVDLENIDNKLSSTGTNPGASNSGNTYTFGSTNDDGYGSSMTLTNVDASKFDTISFDFIGGTIDEFYLIALSGTYNQYNLSTGSGRKTITLQSGDRVSGLEFAFHVGRGGSNNLPVGTNRITNLSFQRRTPMNVFVSLDSPEASAFIRTDPSMQGLSPEDKKKKLMDMLDASNEYLLKQLGIIGSSARPEDTITPDSWEDNITPQQRAEAQWIINSLSKYGDVASVDAIVGPVEDITAIISAIVGALGIGWNAATELYNSITNSRTTSELDPGDSSEGTYQQTPEQELRDRQNAEVQAANQVLQDAIDKYGEDSYEAQQARQARSDLMVQHRKERQKLLGQQGKHDGGKGTGGPQNRSKGDGPPTWYPEQTTRKGRYLSDSKTFKKNLDAVEPKEHKSSGKGMKSFQQFFNPADIKPEYPDQEPPKMKNGFHPDLVDGKNIANRFNKLDPQSAKAMPKTGNPHVDAKVDKAKNNPDKDGPAYRQSVFDKVKKAKR